MVLESPMLISFLRDRFKNQEKQLTRRTGLITEIDLIKGELTIPQVDLKLEIPCVGVAAQELIVAGGLENWVKARI